MNDLKLTDLQQAILLLIKEGRDYQLHKGWIKQIESLEKLYLIQKKPNTDNELMLTVKGEDCLMKGVLIKYPLHNKGNVGSYDSVIKSMSVDARNALVCTMMNERAFDNLPKETARNLGQHLLDIGFYKKWGSILINKWLVQCNKSMKFFAGMDKKYENKS